MGKGAMLRAAIERRPQTYSIYFNAARFVGYGGGMTVTLDRRTYELRGPIGLGQ